MFRASVKQKLGIVGRISQKYRRASPSKVAYCAVPRRYKSIAPQVVFNPTTPGMTTLKRFAAVQRDPGFFGLWPY